MQELSTNLNIYVNSITGSDSLGDGSILAPFATLQYAHDYVQQNYDLVYKYSVTYLAVGNFTGGINESGSLRGQRSPAQQLIRFTGSSTVSGTNTFSAVYGIGYMIDCTSGGVTISASGVGVEAASGSTICLNSGLTFATCAVSTFQTSWGGNLYINNSISVYGNGAQLVFASGGVIQFAPSITTTWIGSSTYSNCVYWAYGQGILGINGQTFNNTNLVHGCRYKAELLGLIATGTNNVNYLPGTAAGGVSFGGIYW